MKRIVILVTEEQDEQLRKLAQRQGNSLAAEVRRAIAYYLRQGVLPLEEVQS